MESQFCYHLECQGCFCQSVRWWVLSDRITYDNNGLSHFLGVKFTVEVEYDISFPIPVLSNSQWSEKQRMIRLQTQEGWNRKTDVGNLFLSVWSGLAVPFAVSVEQESQN